MSSLGRRVQKLESILPAKRESFALWLHELNCKDKGVPFNPDDVPLEMDKYTLDYILVEAEKSGVEASVMYKNLYINCLKES